MRQFHTIVPQNTVGQWVDAFNNNALAASDHTVYLGEMLFSSVLYTGLETICNKKIRSQEYIDLSGVSPREFYFDNWYCYFRNENKIKLIEHQNIDLTPYNDKNLYFLFINSERGYRVSVNSTIISGDEVRICRFMIDTNNRFVQCYPTFQRFGYFGANDDYPELLGLDAKPCSPNMLNREDGKITYDGVKFDFRDLPDSILLDFREQIPIMYNNAQNKIDYAVVQKLDEHGNPMIDEDGNEIYTIATNAKKVDAKKYLNYTTKQILTVPNNKFTVQRILYDIYVDNYVIQYGDNYYDSIDEALNAVYSLNFPFPYTDTVNNIIGNAFPMIGVIVVKSNFTDLTDPAQCRIVNIRSRTTDIRDTELLATDSLARSLIMSIQADLDQLQDRLDALETRVNGIDTKLDDHIHNRFRPSDDATYNWAAAPYKNPHHVTPEDLGMGPFRIDWTIDTEIPNAKDDQGRYIYRNDAKYANGIMYTPYTLPMSVRTKTYVDNMANTLRNEFNARFGNFVKKTGDTMTGSLIINNANLECTGEVKGTNVTATNNFVKVGGTKFYVGTLPAGADVGSYGIKAG